MAEIKHNLPNLYTSEFQEYDRLYLLGGQRSISGNISFTSASSNITYNSSTGQQGILQELQTVLTPYLISAEDYNVLSDDLQGHVTNVSNPHAVTATQVGLGNVQNYGLATQSEAEAGASGAKYMTPQRTKQYVDTRIRMNNGIPEIFNGTEWIQMGGDPTLNKYFGFLGSFPFIGDAGDVTIAANTTWNDAIGYKRVKKLTINAGVTLRITQSPFYIFADEIVFGSATSTIDASGFNGADAWTDTTVMGFARGGYAENKTYPFVAAKGGCGGGILVIVAKKISGAAGVIKANGGNGWVNVGGRTDQSGTANEIGQDGYLSLNSANLTSISYSIFGGGGIAKLTNSSGIELAPPRSLDKLVSKPSLGAASSGGYSLGFGAGGSADTGSLKPSLAPTTYPSGEGILDLASFGIYGGGGGGALGLFAQANEPQRAAGGGGGGGILVLARSMLVTPTLQANGGAGATGGTYFGSNGIAGVTQLITV